MLLDYIIENKNEILNIFEKHGAYNITIIGSVSKRKETKDSDIDFVADMKKNNSGQVDLEEYMDLIKDLKIYFNRKIDLSTHDQINNQYPDALKNGICLVR